MKERNFGRNSNYFNLTFQTRHLKEGKLLKLSSSQSLMIEKWSKTNFRGFLNKLLKFSRQIKCNFSYRVSEWKNLLKVPLNHFSGIEIKRTSRTYKYSEKQSSFSGFHQEHTKLVKKEKKERKDRKKFFKYFCLFWSQVKNYIWS